MMQRYIGSILLLASLTLFSAEARAYSTLQVWNNTGKMVLEAGDMVQVMIQHSLDEQFSEIYFGTASRTIYTGGWNDPPFITKMNSSDGQKKDVLIEFTVPHDFSSHDSVFIFSARLFKDGTSYKLSGHQSIAVRGIPGSIAPVEAADIKGVVNFDWYPVYGATQYHFELVRFIDGIDPKGDVISAAEIALDTLIETNSLVFIPAKTGKYSWVVRAKANDVWGSWGPASTFNLTSTASVSVSDLSSGITLYPLPANDVIHIESSVGDVQRVQVYDLAGKQLMADGNIVGPTRSFDVKHLAPGLYHVKIVLNTGETIIPFIKR